MMETALTPPTRRPAPLDTLLSEDVRRLELFVSDIDGTLTTEGRFPEDLFHYFKRLRDCGLRIVLATGRSAGMAQSLAIAFPFIEGVIGENGAVYYPADGDGDVLWLNEEMAGEDFRRRMQETWQDIAERYPIRKTTDAVFRLAEISFVREKSFGFKSLREMEAIAEDHGLGLTASTIHVHIMHPAAGKDRMVKRLCRDWGFDAYEQVVTMGDSPNDRPLFTPENFRVSIGTAGIAEFTEELGPDHPAFITPSTESEGFKEAVRMIVKRRER